jgi:hypothetical protein
MTLCDCLNTTTQIFTIVGAVATAMYTLLTYKLLKSTAKSFETTNKLAEFQIYSEISKLLNTEESNKLINTISSNWFNIDKMPNVVTYPTTHSPELIYSHNLNRHVLGPLEDLAKFYNDGLIELNSINTGWGSLIIKLWENDKIKDYILYLRETNNDINLYSGLENLYGLIKDGFTKQHLDIKGEKDGWFFKKMNNVPAAEK